jgi:hypothetical protein
VDPAAALAHVAAVLPELDEPARRALAEVDLVGRTPAPGSAATLARARKELRRASFPLSATGWCERAERLVSDALDSPLGPRPRRMLDAHLRRCERCVEHERRLAQARDALARSFVEAHEPRPEPAPAPPAPDLRVIEEAIPEVEERVHGVEDRLASIEQSIDSSEQRVLDRVGIVEQRLAEMAARLEELAAARAEVPVEPAPAEPAPVEPLPVDEPPVEPPPVVASEPPKPAAFTTRALDRAFAPAPPGRQFIPAGGPWQWLALLAVLLALAVVAVTVAGIAGVHRIF